MEKMIIEMIQTDIPPKLQKKLLIGSVQPLKMYHKEDVQKSE